MKRNSQAAKLLSLLSDNLFHSTPEIQRVVYGADHLGSARIAARIADLRAKGHQIEGKKDAENPAIFLYRLVPEGPDQTIDIVTSEPPA